FEIVAFDADDTLWHNEPFYQEAKEKFVRLFSASLDPGRVAETLDRVEIDNVEYYGYGIKSFILSMIEVAAQLTGDQITGDVIEQILDFAKQMLRFNLQLFDGAKETLAELAASHELMLITKGDQFEQERKIARSGLGGYFKYIEIVGEKSPHSYRRLLGKYGVAPEKFLMIGNSLKSDILPVLDIGGTAIYIPYDSTWVLEHLDDAIVAHYDYHQLEHIGQLPDYIRNLV
ncbi:MAG: HAD family hydrolase, partial [Anaerolineales bacterium]|nr:HAD family hydrolase [Anaerolineales bacterium]